MAAQEITKKLDKLIEVTTRLDERQNAMKETVDHISTKVDTISTKVTSLELWRSKVIGYGAAIATIISILIHFISRAFSSK
jgi:tetrahydromethanopterin S-methyltransferase subunit G